MNWPQNIGEWGILFAGVWAVLFITGLGMRAFDWLMSWSKKKK